MDCQLCQKNLDAYLEDGLSSDMKNQVESHLGSCASCKQIFLLQLLADEVIRTEKELVPDPFLITRVMAQIENREKAGCENATILEKFIRPALISVSLAAAVLFGIMLGNLSRPAGDAGRIPLELALIDDVALESVDFLSND